MLFENWKLIVYTDGACSNNPGIGGYSFIVLNENGDVIKKYSNGFNFTTNNRMELMAVIEALNFINTLNCKNIVIYSDSKYVVDSLKKKWLEKWIKDGFKKTRNRDLWKKYLKVSEGLSIEFIWIEGHSGNKYNEYCDKLAKDCIKNKKLQADKKYSL